MTLKKIVCIVGTRPEAIKMAPVVRAFRASEWATTVVVSTGQHRELLTQTLAAFGIEVDVELDLMQAGQSLAGLTARLFAGLDGPLADMAPDLVLVQGDTTTVMVASMVCFYRGIPVAHVEAGLRTHDLAHPFPEEFNRVVTGRIAALHFAPTAAAKANLLAEGCPAARVRITGNTGIDALMDMSARTPPTPFDDVARMVLVTVHRRENFGEPLLRVCSALRRLHALFPDVTFVWPLHPNPNVRNVVEVQCADLPRVRLIAPAGYAEMVGLLKRSTFVITDSGGIQEEAPALGRPVLVVRDVTERPEAVEAGVVRLVGTDEDLIVAEASRLLSDGGYRDAMSRGSSPYGDGAASGRIVAISRAFLEGSEDDTAAVPDWEPGTQDRH